MAYYSVEPFGEERADLRNGILASVVANTGTDPKKRKRPFDALDFMPYAERPAAKPADPAALTAAFKSVYKKKKKR